MVIWQVDDDPVHLFLAARLIRRANPTAQIVSFENAREVAEKLLSEKPDLIMLDLNMPEMDGWEFLETVQHRTNLPQIVVLTSSIDPRDKARAFSFACVKDFLIKPVRMSDLVGVASPA